MVKWELLYTKQAQKDARHLARSGLRSKAEKLLELLAHNPFQQPPPFEKLRGDLDGAYSRRINIQHRLVYQVLSDQRTVKVIRLWTHYE
jgi:toxin YoeB